MIGILRCESPGSGPGPDVYWWRLFRQKGRPSVLCPTLSGTVPGLMNWPPPVKDINRFDVVNNVLHGIHTILPGAFKSDEETADGLNSYSEQNIGIIRATLQAPEQDQTNPSINSKYHVDSCNTS